MDKKHQCGQPLINLYVYVWWLWCVGVVWVLVFFCIFFIVLGFHPNNICYNLIWPDIKPIRSWSQLNQLVKIYGGCTKDLTIKPIISWSQLNQQLKIYNNSTHFSSKLKLRKIDSFGSYRVNQELNNTINPIYKLLEQVKVIRNEIFHNS
jgi:hypothetical protein